MDKKVFLIINSYFIGDILLTNSLVQNIKRIYPEAVVVMLTSHALTDIAKYQQGVDDVIIWDRKGVHKSLIGMMKFILNFPYKKIYASIPVYGMDRPVFLALLLKSKYILAPVQKFFSKFRKIKYELVQNTSTTQEQLMQYLTGITKEKLINVPIKYNLPDGSFEIADSLPENYIVLCLTSTRKNKDIPINIACELVEKLKNSVIVLVGSGNVIQEYSNVFKKKQYSNLIDISNKTSLLEVAAVIKKSRAMISVDTGLMHMACALNTPLITVFYEKNTKAFIPDENLYRCRNIMDEQTPEHIIDVYNELIKEKSVI